MFRQPLTLPWQMSFVSRLRCQNSESRWHIQVSFHGLTSYVAARATPTFRHKFISATRWQSAATANKKRRFQDPYVLAQARARKAANQSRQAALRVERSRALGDPVRGIPTAFVESFDTALNLDMTTTTSTEPTEGINKTEFLNHFVEASELEQTMARSQELTSPIIEPSQDPETLDRRIRAHKEHHENALQALSRIISLENAGAKDRLRVNIQRCVEAFGRHNTDKYLMAKPSKTQRSVDKIPRTGPDTGSSEVQAAILTAKIRALANFLVTRGKKDKVNKRNLRLLVHKRQKHLTYLRRKERGGERWRHLIKTLGLTEGTWKGEISL